MADGDVFVYLGGEQVVPDEITHAIIDPSVKIVRAGAFRYREQLVSIIFHDGVEIIEGRAFTGCRSLRRIKLLGVREIGSSAFNCCYDLTDAEFGDKLETIGNHAFYFCNSLTLLKLLGVREIREGAFESCHALTDVEFGDKLETIEHKAFRCCRSLRSIKIPTVRTVQAWVFDDCEQLTDVEFGVNLERIGLKSFLNCSNLQRVAIPLKDDLFPFDPIEHRYTQFHCCEDLTTVDLAGADGINSTISSFLMESWKDEMKEEITRINLELPSTHVNRKTGSIRRWIRHIIDRFDHYKAEHNRLLKEHMTLLELVIWKAKLEEKDDDSTERVQAKRAKLDEESAREEKRITSGADTIIKNVLPFLKLL